MKKKKKKTLKFLEGEQVIKSRAEIKEKRNEDWAQILVQNNRYKSQVSLKGRTTLT